MKRRKPISRNSSKLDVIILKRKEMINEEKLTISGNFK